MNIYTVFILLSGLTFQILAFQQNPTPEAEAALVINLHIESTGIARRQVTRALWRDKFLNEILTRILKIAV